MAGHDPRGCQSPDYRHEHRPDGRRRPLGRDELQLRRAGRLAPDGTATVDVEATPPPRGDRVVAFTVNTDSSATPAVALSLRMIGFRRAPYLAGVDGELGYPEDDPTGVVRELTVYMVERPESDRTPAPRSDLP